MSPSALGRKRRDANPSLYLRPAGPHAGEEKGNMMSEEPSLGDYVRLDDAWWEIVADVDTAQLRLMKVGLSKPPQTYWRAKRRDEELVAYDGSKLDV